MAEGEEGLPKALIELGLDAAAFHRLDFLWRAAGAYAQPCPTLARRYAAQFKSLARVELHSIVGSDFFATDLCGHCHSRLEPGVNCTVRVRHRSKRSPLSRKLTAKSRGGAAPEQGLGRPQNQLVMTCALCGASTRLPGCTKSARQARRAASPVMRVFAAAPPASAKRAAAAADKPKRAKKVTLRQAQAAAAAEQLSALRPPNVDALTGASSASGAAAGAPVTEPLSLLEMLEQKSRKKRKSSAGGADALPSQQQQQQQQQLQPPPQLLQQEVKATQQQQQQQRLPRKLDALPPQQQQRKPPPQQQQQQRTSALQPQPKRKKRRQQAEQETLIPTGLRDGRGGYQRAVWAFLDGGLVLAHPVEQLFWQGGKREAAHTLAMWCAK
ncbi:hypothetical protein JKP88DRAFT_289007 [Tribonema minus]|uniref:Uncharacterized protein n=1 Tax=Tribonema minus TaxID=303371 RepID=A0A835Z2F4_9STRA|nr:hypothetical protein JKP88DRAFT_289007 [Tribonema minus]